MRIKRRLILALGRVALSILHLELLNQWVKNSFGTLEFVLTEQEVLRALILLLICFILLSVTKSRSLLKQAAFHYLWCLLFIVKEDILYIAALPFKLIRVYH